MIAYLDCFSGISGDMLLGALIDAGLEIAALRDGLRALPLKGYTLDHEPLSDHGISGTRISVRVEEPQHVHRHLPDLLALLESSSLPREVREKVAAVFTRLADAEAVIHGTTRDEIAFHEVGAIDSIVDTVGTVLGFHLLGIEEIYCSELPLTSGRVRSEHGSLPVPAPATVELLKGSGAVWRPVDVDGELVTPTGAAILAAFARFERPRMRITHTGYGFGQRQLPWANCLRLLAGPAVAGEISDSGFERDEIVVIETNIDNMTGEVLGWLMDRLLASGALDVSFTPVQMKKNRPATLLTVLALPQDAERLGGILLRESLTLGVRFSRADRLKAPRHIETIETPLGTARIKVKRIGDRVVSATPEYDDCRAIAEQHQLPLDAVVTRFSHAARAHFGLDE